MLHPRFDQSLRKLIHSWENHQRLSGHASIADLAVSRAELDKARLHAAQIRRMPV